MTGEGIFFHYHIPAFRVANANKVKAWIADCSRHFHRQIGRIDYIFCTDEFVLALNQEYLDHDTYTDIITFDYSHDSIISGEIYISIDRIRENAHTYGTSMLTELHRVMIHGTLHLCSYDDSDAHAKAEMTDKEDYCLSLRTFL